MEQGDSLDISWVGVLTITLSLSLVVNKEVIIFTMIPSCLKLEMDILFMLRLNSFSLPEMKYLAMLVC